jgi:hypothetical protein
MGYYDAMGSWREGDPNYGYDTAYTGATSNPNLQNIQPQIYNPQGTYGTTGNNTGQISGNALGPVQNAVGYTLTDNLMDGGLGFNQAAGLAGNAFKESAGFTVGQQNDGGPGVGLFQWELPTGGGSGRGSQFENWMTQTGVGVNPQGGYYYMDPQANAGFYLHESQQPGFSSASWQPQAFWDATSPGDAASGIMGLTGRNSAGRMVNLEPGYFRPMSGGQGEQTRVNAANNIGSYYQSMQDPGYQSGNYYGDPSGGGYSYPDPQLNNGANYGYNYADVGNSNPYLDQFSNAINTGQLNTTYNKGGSTGPQYVTDSSGITRAVQGQQSYGNNEYGYGGGYDPQAYGYQQDYSGGFMGGQNTTGYMNYSGQPDFTVGGSSGSSGGYDWNSPGGYGAGASYSPGYSIQPGTAAASYGGGMTLGDTQMAGQVYNDAQAYAQNYADMYQNQLNNQMQTQNTYGQNQFNQNMANTGTSTYAGGGNLWSQYQPY